MRMLIKHSASRDVAAGAPQQALAAGAARGCNPPSALQPHESVLSVPGTRQSLVSTDPDTGRTYLYVADLSQQREIFVLSMRRSSGDCREIAGEGHPAWKVEFVEHWRFLEPYKLK